MNDLLTDAQLDMLESEYSCGHGFGLVQRLFRHARAANEELANLAGWSDNAAHDEECGCPECDPEQEVDPASYSEA